MELEQTTERRERPRGVTRGCCQAGESELTAVTAGLVLEPPAAVRETELATRLRDAEDRGRELRARVEALERERDATLRAMRAAREREEGYAALEERCEALRMLVADRGRIAADKFKLEQQLAEMGAERGVREAVIEERRVLEVTKRTLGESAARLDAERGWIIAERRELSDARRRLAERSARAEAQTREFARVVAGRRALAPTARRPGSKGAAHRLLKKVARRARSLVHLGRAGQGVLERIASHMTAPVQPAAVGAEAALGRSRQVVPEVSPLPAPRVVSAAAMDAGAAARGFGGATPTASAALVVSAPQAAASRRAAPVKGGSIIAGIIQQNLQLRRDTKP